MLKGGVATPLQVDKKRMVLLRKAVFLIVPSCSYAPERVRDKSTIERSFFRCRCPRKFFDNHPLASNNYNIVIITNPLEMFTYEIDRSDNQRG
jgi:hypothetical protein